MPVAGGAQPPSLHVGDRVAVVAPSGPVDPLRLERGCTVLRTLGLDVVVGKHALDRRDSEGSPSPRPPRGSAPGGPPPHGPPGLSYLAGADADRAADLTEAWCDPGIAAILCARGGYGAARVLDHLDWARLAAVPPTLLHGSSDITALHAVFGQRLGCPTSFGPMVASLVADAEPEALAYLEKGLFGARVPVPGAYALREGRAEGRLTGGTLALLTSLLGTPYAPEPATGRIAFLEDVGEPAYRVDRMLTQLLQAGWFDGVVGVALGTWTGCDDDLDAVFADRLGPLGVPMLAGLPVGHGPRQLTLRLGAPAILDTVARTLATNAAS